ncbi:hypothetical protein BG53_07725 [Paenibacillus darwinianus]|uniref:ATP-grasp domain-containing protein n=3 Tax=Paenibacillus darwinianus TaxID=1380763 RepID=A0A9W5RZU7_9BACL|nr:ATP-grasp domain-containing protein [Paenibacillus darwinianus]EXX85699.1 hypothetical protein CH50_08960 [Paenibacillus darwinianus]EXX85753.1 hypothetical protein BG53_07725 [Paenibacillus darwinianus]
MALLLTDGMLRMTLAAARSVGAAGVPVGVGETSLINTAAFSKYCGERWRYPDPRAFPGAFRESLADRLERGKYRTVFAMDEPALDIVVANRRALGELCELPVPPTESYRIARDKGLSAWAAAAAGVEAPATEQPASLEDVLPMARKLSFPVVVKPRNSSGSRGIRVVYAEEELPAVYEAVHCEFPFPVLQAYIPAGIRYDVCLLYDREGRLKASFVQKELRHFPHPAGPSTMQQSVWMPELLERAKAVMSRLPWYGVAELEFMVDPRDGIPKFMEINPRFWGSLHLAVRSGVDFPRLLYRIALGERVKEVTAYEVGRLCRNLFPGEALQVLVRPDRMRLDPPAWAGKRSGGEDDILSWTDPMPALGLLATCGRFMFDRGVWRSLIRR